MKVLAIFVSLALGASLGQNPPDKPLYGSGAAPVLSHEDLAYPPIAIVTRIQGVVVIKADLDNQGNVVSAAALAGPQLMIADAISNIKKWKFRPNSGNTVIMVYDFRFDSDFVCQDRRRSSFRLEQPNLATIIGCSPTIQP